LLKAQVEIDKEQYDSAVNILVDAIQNRQLRDSKLQNKLREAQVLAKRAKSKDYYKILGVDRSATEKEIKKGYRQKTKEYHPDKYRGDLTAEQVERKMAEINEAYEILGDAEMRRKYDNGEIGEDGNVMNNGFHGHPHGFQQGFPGGGFAQQFGGFQFSQGGGSPFGQQFFMKQDRR
jgi:DnaJ family protein C protein 3